MVHNRLSMLLGERRWTQADLARATGIRPQTINDLYHGVAHRVGLEQLDLICSALGCTIGELLVSDGEKSATRTRSGHEKPVVSGTPNLPTAM